MENVKKSLKYKLGFESPLHTPPDHATKGNTN